MRNPHGRKKLQKMWMVFGSCRLITSTWSTPAYRLLWETGVWLFIDHPLPFFFVWPPGESFLARGFACFLHWPFFSWAIRKSHRTNSKTVKPSLEWNDGFVNLMLWWLLSYQFKVIRFRCAYDLHKINSGREWINIHFYHVFSTRHRAIKYLL